MAEAIARSLRDGRLDGEHAPALCVEDSLHCPLGHRAIAHFVSSLLAQIASAKSQSNGIVLVAFDRSSEYYLDLMRQSRLDSSLIQRCVRILDCYSDPLGWKQHIRREQSANNGEQLTTMKGNVVVCTNVRDVDKLLCSIIDLGRGFQGEGKTYFSVAIDLAQFGQALAPIEAM